MDHNAAQRHLVHHDGIEEFQTVEAKDKASNTRSVKRNVPWQVRHSYVVGIAAGTAHSVRSGQEDPSTSIMDVFELTVAG